VVTGAGINRVLMDIKTHFKVGNPVINESIVGGVRESVNASERLNASEMYVFTTKTTGHAHLPASKTVSVVRIMTGRS
jgi:hypothetical protein